MAHYDPACVIGVVAMEIPGTVFVDPGIDEASAVNYGLASLGSRQATS
jgi:hypothetical protein